MKSKLTITTFIISIIQIFFLIIILIGDYLISKNIVSAETLKYIPVPLFLSVFVTLFLSIISLRTIKKKKLKGKWMAITSLMVSISLIVLAILFIISLFFF